MGSICYMWEGWCWNGQILSNEMWLCAMVKACPDSYLSRISQIIFVETKLSCGEIWSFYKDFEQFVEFYQSFCRFCSQFLWRKICVEKVCVEKKWQKRGLVLDGALEPDQKAYDEYANFDTFPQYVAFPDNFLICWLLSGASHNKCR